MTCTRARIGFNSKYNLNDELNFYLKNAIKPLFY